MLTTSVTNYTHIPGTPYDWNCSIFFQLFGFLTVGASDSCSDSAGWCLVCGWSLARVGQSSRSIVEPRLLPTLPDSLID